MCYTQQIQIKHNLHNTIQRIPSSISIPLKWVLYQQKLKVTQTKILRNCHFVKFDGRVQVTESTGEEITECINYLRRRDIQLSHSTTQWRTPRYGSVCVQKERLATPNPV